MAGFTPANSRELETALLQLAADGEAFETRRNAYGLFYVVEGNLAGPNGRVIRVRTVWILREDGRSHVVTLVPVRTQA